MGTGLDISEVETRDGILHEKTFKALIKKIENVPIKVIPPNPLVLDGEWFGIEYGINRLKWWGEGPEKWHKLTSLWNELVDSLEDSLKRDPLNIKTLEIDHKE
jgi:hypothetical protein